MKKKAARELQQSCGHAGLVAVPVKEAARVTLLKAHRPPGTPSDTLQSVRHQNRLRHLFLTVYINTLLRGYCVAQKSLSHLLALMSRSH